MSLNLYSAGKVDDLLSAKLSDAPSDGSTYGRKDGAWEVVSGGGASWGSITGTLSSQTDLATALGDKADVSGSTAISVSGAGGTSTLGADSGATVSADNGSGSITKLTTTGITFPDSTTQTTAATYDAKKAIANACASCFSANVYTPIFQFIGHVAMALYMSGKFSGSGQYQLGVGTPGYTPSVLLLTSSSDSVGNVTANSSFSFTSVAGQSIAYSDDYGTTWTYSDLVI